MWVLVPVAFAPDWVQWFAAALGRENRVISHSLVSVAIGATLTGLLYATVTRAGRDAMVVALTYASHWPADFITGIKPTWPGGPEVGLVLYNHPTADVELESALLVVCWLVYRRTLPAAKRNHALAVVLPLGLIAMQIGFSALQRQEF